jgi:prepilin-type processing-associated H-X9-DG protein
MGVGALPTWDGLGKGNEDYYAIATRFASKHPGVVQFVFADGSVRRLRKGSSWIDWGNWDLANLWPNSYPAGWWVFQELGGMGDGGVRDPSVLE